MIRFFSFLFVLIFLSACGGSQQAQPIAYPSWYLNPPQNSASFLYGVGEGSDISAAKASALNAVAASLSITVSSEFKKSESSSSYNGNENAYHSALSTVKAQVKALEFSDYKVIQNQLISNKILVLVEVSRVRLFQDQKAKLERYSKELLAEEKNIRLQTPLKQTHIYATSLEKRQKLTSLALLSKSINPSFDSTPYEKQAAKIKQNRADAANATRVSIKAAPEAKRYVDAIQEGLNQIGIKTVDSRSNAIIRLESRFQTDEIYGFKLAKATLSISTKDIKQKNIATNTLIISGKSRYDYEKAKANSVQILRKKIQTDGIFAVLGIQ